MTLAAEVAFRVDAATVLTRGAVTLVNVCRQPTRHDYRQVIESQTGRAINIIIILNFAVLLLDVLNNI